MPSRRVKLTWCDCCVSKCDLGLICVVKVIQALNDDDNDLVMMFDQTYRHPHSNRTFTVCVDFQKPWRFSLQRRKTSEWSHSHRCDDAEEKNYY